jgi:hypothetical protein
MKNLFLFVFFFLLNNLFGQKPVFHDLKDPKMHAGCYINGKENAAANLTGVDDDGALFNFKGKDEVFPSIKGTKEYPEAFGNKTYRIYLKVVKSTKDGESCLENIQYSVKVIYKKKAYFYTKKGICGC